MLQLYLWHILAVKLEIITFHKVIYIQPGKFHTSRDIVLCLFLYFEICKAVCPSEPTIRLSTLYCIYMFIQECSLGISTSLLWQQLGSSFPPPSQYRSSREPVKSSFNTRDLCTSPVSRVTFDCFHRVFIFVQHSKTRG